MIFSFFYDIAIHVFAIGSLPKIIWNWKKYRGTFANRLGWGFAQIKKGNKQLIWVHAVSVGETKAVTPLIKRLKAQSNPPLILLSTITKTGQAEAKKSEADWTVYLPFDFRYVISRVMRHIQPDVVIITETDFWYHFQKTAKKCGAKLFVVNGKLSNRSYLRYKRFPRFIRYLLQPIDHFYLQGAIHADRLQTLGIAKEKITITGNIKLDASINHFNDRVKESHYVITLGSTHDPEELLWIKALKQLWPTYSQIKLIIAPRHPERFDIVAALLEKEGLHFVRSSEGGEIDSSSILLVDTIGELTACYQRSDLAFVGGSFTPKVGGHNILEPCFYGTPVLFGPFMHAQPDLVDLVLSYQSGLQITPEEIVKRVIYFIETRSYGHQLGKNGIRLIAESQGALDKTYEHLLEKSNV